MDEAEENKYVSQLKEVFDSCDTTGTGYLDKEELTELCHKLHLEAQLPVLLQILLGTDHYARVNFEEFKEGFVAVLSSTIEFSTSDEDSSYLEPAIPDEVKPKYIKGTKRYGRRTHPEVQDSEVETTGDLGEQLIHGTKKCQLKRSASLESVESLKSDEETESNKEIFEAQGQMRTWKTDVFCSPRKTSSPYVIIPENQVQGIWDELGVGQNGYLSRQELAIVCENIGLKEHKVEELDDLFINLDKDKDGRISLKEFQHGLFIHFPLSLPTSSTPFKQRRLGCLQQAFEEIQCRTASPSLLSNALGTHLFSSIDDGTGYVNAEQIVNIWKEEGIENSRKILETLDFTVEEKLNLAELTMALDNELMVSKNGIHQAVLASYKNEIHYLQVQVESTCKEKDKVKADLKKAEKCNLQLAKEVDERHAAIEHLNENKIKGLEQEYKEKTTAVLSEMDKERELIMQQVNTQRAKLETEIDSLRTEESHLREKLSLVMKENCRLQKELVEVVEKLSESEGLVSKLQKDLNYMLKEKLSMVDPQNTELFNQEERFAEIIKEYEQQCRELRDQNDELQSELEVLRSQLQERRPRRLLGTIKDKPVRIGADGRIIWTDSDSDDDIHVVKKDRNLRVKRQLPVAGRNGAKSPDLEPTKFSIETELMVEQLKEQHQQKVQDLKIQLETKVNYYEREIELMKRNFEKERKDVEQSFKIEISELEEQKADLEEQSEKLQGLIDELRDQLQRSVQTQDLERRVRQERAEMEQYYAKEISELGQRLAEEKDRLEAELQEKHQQDLQLLRKETEAELRKRLAQMESQYTENQKVLMKQHQCEQKETEQRCSLELQKLKEQYSQEKLLWEAKEQEIMDLRKEKLKFKEKMNEEQAQICNTFAVEKEAMENQYREQIHILSCETECLKAQLMDINKTSKNANVSESREPDNTYKWENNECHKATEVFEKQNDSTKKFYAQLEAEEEELGLLSNHDQDLATQLQNKVDMINKQETELIKKNNLIKKQKEQLTKQEELNEQLFAQLKSQEEELSLKNKREHELFMQLQQKEDLLHSVKQKHDSEVKEMENDLKKQKQQLEEKSNLCQQISVQLDAKQQQLILVRRKEQDLLVVIEQKDDMILVQKSKLKSLLEEKDDHLEKLTDLCKERDHLHQQLSSQLEAQKEKLLLFKKKEEGLINQIQQANNMMQQQEARHEVDLKAKDELLQKQKAVLVEQAVYHQVSGKVTAKEKELSLRQKEQDLPFQFQHSVCAACKQKTEYESNLRQREELVEKKIKLFEEQMSSQQTQLCAKEEEILIMKRKEQAMLCQLQQQEAEADVRVQQIKEEVKKEKNQLKENLLELEDLVHTLENETDAGRKCRNELNGLYEENCSLKGKVGRFQEEIHNLETEVEKQRKQLEALKWDKEKAQHEMGSLNEQNKNYKDEMHLLNTRNLQLSGEISNLSAKLETCQNTIQLLHKRLEEVTHQKQEAALVTKQLQEASTKLEKEQIQEQSLWQREKEMMDQELKISRNKLLEAITKLNVAQSQHVREVQQLREQVGFAVSKDQLNHVQLKLAEEQQKVRQLQEQLSCQADQADKQMAAQQEEHEKVLKKMGERMEEVEMKLKNVRIILQEKVNQLKDQLAKNTKSDMMLKDLYVENSQLMKALQVTEQRQKSAEKKNFQMEEKIVALNKLLRKIAPASLTA
ncbi:ninein-like protein isoform X2 [Latimeria chalumnae]|uniref:ninein-like protein isoform X2 n=1 Tax=Latimeria chalumnae TaxID=7897 RepID=UPI00313CB9B9